MTDSEGGKYRILPPEKLAEKLGAMGINEQAKIVLYGDADTSWGSEGWGLWMLVWLGHQGPVRFLDGGINSWQQAGLPMEKGKAPGRKKQPVGLPCNPRQISQSKNCWKIRTNTFWWMSVQPWNGSRAIFPALFTSSGKKFFRARSGHP